VVWLYPEKELSESGWLPITYKIISEEEDTQEVKMSQVLIVNSEANYGVISDIDDTVLISHATQTLRKLRLILTKNAKTRLPFPGVRTFYDALAGDRKRNPIFYVSSSEWNLYDFLVDFFDERALPKGPFLLQNFKSGLKELVTSGGGSHQHKQEKIQRLMELFPALSFVLIGDSGQRDPEIYAEAVTKYPGRVKAIYIRAIGQKKKLDQDLVRQTHAKNVEMVLVKNTTEAYEHALSQGFIAPQEKMSVVE
jgi:phosphatidate phosphatase APP1